MPDRSKKRKKNKNKRKHKNGSHNVLKVQSADAAATTAGSDSGDSCDEQKLEVNEQCVVNTDIKDDNKIITNLNVAADIEKGYKQDCERENIAINNEILQNNEILKYIVETPEFSKKTEKIKISEIPKSKSLDDIEAPKIEEITSECGDGCHEISVPFIIDSAIVSEAESDVEWEVAHDLADDVLKSDIVGAIGILSTNTVSMNVAECEQTQALSPEEELSLRQYLQTLNLVTCPQEPSNIEIEQIEEVDSKEETKKVKKIPLSDEIPKQKHRFLEVIDEEGSNESSLASRRQSYLKEDFTDLDDDVFQDENKKIEPLDKYPVNKNAKPQLKNKPIPQECLLVGAKIVQPKIDEGCGEWTVHNMAKLKGAEIVYLTDSSSSASDIYDIGEEPENEEEDPDDSSVRITTPIIEINNTAIFQKDSDYINKEKPDIEIAEKSIASPHIIISDEFQANESTSADNKIDEDKEIIVSGSENKIPSLYVLKIDEEQTSHQFTENVVTKKTMILSNEKPVDQSDLILSSNKSRQNEPHFILNQPRSKIDTEINALKLELNNAFSSLMHEVLADKENIQKTNTISRQDSSSSIGSSQCTAKYNPTTSSLTDIANLVHDTTDLKTADVPLSHENIEVKNSHVKDVFAHVTGSEQTRNTKEQFKENKPLRLKELCLKRITDLPYGENILEELASVSKQLQTINVCGVTDTTETMPFYPLPDVSAIKKVSLATKLHNNATVKSAPPPVAPRHSSLKLPHDDLSWTGIPTKKDPSLYVCLSPSQKMLMEKTNTMIDEDDANELLDVHKKYIDRRGYDEYYSKRTRENSNAQYNEAIPFKSQTGNRLLAIIRDPAVNISSKVNKWNNFKKNLQQSSSYNNVHKDYEPIKPRYSHSARDLRSEMSFKPIPPPRPRKYSSTLYESDESSDFTDHSFQSVSERKYFHYSTGNLNKEIEMDISNIQDMHRKYTAARDNFKEKYLQAPEPVRRPSLPKDICEQQMEYIRQKEKEVEAEIRKLESDKNHEIRYERNFPRAPVYSENEMLEQNRLHENNYSISRKNDFAIHSDKLSSTTKQVSSSFKSSQEEIMREKMYSEYMTQMAEREERKQHKIIKITTKPLSNDGKSLSTSIPTLTEMRSGNNRIEEEFILKAKERWDKLGIKDPETEDERETKDTYQEPKVLEHKIKVLEGGEEKDVKRLPNHLREFVQFTAKGDKEGARSPGESATATSLFVVVCAVVIVIFAIGKRMLPFFKDNNN